MSRRVPVSARAKRAAIAAERRWDSARLARVLDRPPRELTVLSYGGHGRGDRVVVRGRVLDGAEPAGAVAGERVRDVLRRNLARFVTDELPGVPLLVTVGGAAVATVTDEEGYFHVELAAGLAPTAGPWAAGTVLLGGAYRGLAEVPAVPLAVRVPGPAARVGVISDVDDTVLATGAQRTWEMLRATLLGSALTRTPLAGAAELYRGLAAGGTGGEGNPLFYVSSSPWNLHGFLLHFLEHRQFPAGPVLLRDLLGDQVDRTHAGGKLAHIEEVLALHPDLGFVLVGDSGQHDPEIYAEVVRRHPDRIRAVYVREVRLDPGDGRVEAVTDGWASAVPFVLAPDSAVMAAHAAGLGLVALSVVPEVEQALRAQD